MSLAQQKACARALVLANNGSALALDVLAHFEQLKQERQPHKPPSQKKCELCSFVLSLRQ